MGSGSVCIIKEIYDTEYANEKFESELETALRKGISTIVVEPAELADQTGRWITVGTFFYKAAVLLGISSLIWSLVRPESSKMYVCLTGSGCICSTIYAVSWRSDPCSNYQVERSGRHLSRLQIPYTATAVVFRKRSRRQSALFPISTSFLSLGSSLYGIYRHRIYN